MTVVGCTHIGSRGPEKIHYTLTIFNDDNTTRSQQVVLLDNQEEWFRNDSIIINYSDSSTSASLNVGDTGENVVTAWDVAMNVITGTIAFMLGSGGI